MKTFSITMISVLAMSGVALAQGTAKGSGAAGATVGAGATVQAKTGATTTAGAKAGATAQTGAAVKMEVPKPPAEIAASLKAMGARGRCTGTGLGHDMKTMVDFKGVTTNKKTLDGWWIQSSMTGTVGKGKTSTKMKMESYMTYDTAAGKWRTLGVMNDGSSMQGWAEMKDGKWEGTSEMTGPMGSGQFREHGDMTNPKAGMTMWGEISMDKGKTWIKVYEMTCKK